MLAPRPILKSNNWNVIVHLEVVRRPTPIEATWWHDGSLYDLHGWMKSNFNGKHTDAQITSGEVNNEGIPQAVTWQSTVMGEPNYSWKFSFHEGGRMVVWVTSLKQSFYFHRQ
ncbi:hypothetical protein [Edaphobacter aggregans]|nr:hypothetical protein [Edaphobacter aggregans]